jgi:hypothetical protein
MKKGVYYINSDLFMGCVFPFWKYCAGELHFDYFNILWVDLLLKTDDNWYCKMLNKDTKI